MYDLKTKIRLLFAFLALLVIWSAMPLAMTIVVRQYSPFDALYLRLIIALFCVQCIRLARNTEPMNWERYWRIYFWAGVGIFPSGAFGYWSALYLPSGFYAVVFGLMPIYVFMTSYFIGDHKKLNSSRIRAMVSSIIGLFCLSYSQLFNGGVEPIGVLLVMVSAAFFALSIVMLGRYASTKAGMLNQIQGSLVYSVTCFTVLLPFISEGSVGRLEPSGILGLLFLGVFGSVVSTLFYYYLLRNMSVEIVSTVFLATPVFAVLLGWWFNMEQYERSDCLGILLVMASLLFFQRAERSGPKTEYSESSL